VGPRAGLNSSDGDAPGNNSNKSNAYTTSNACYIHFKCHPAE